MEIIVIGAGIAGLAAARDLIQRGYNVTILEARNRLGGRVHTDRTLFDIPVEFGAEFLHGDRIPTWEIVKQLQLRTLHWRKTDDSLVRMADGSLRTMEDARKHSPAFDITRTWKLPDLPPHPEDESLEAYLRRIGFTAAQLYYVRRSYGNAAGDDMRYISARACMEEWRDDTGGDGDYRILDGYDRLTGFLAEGLDIRQNTAVKIVDWSRQRIIIHTNGESFECDKVVITLPIGVLQSGDVEFVPVLPLAKQSAIQNLRMGPVIKLVYGFAEPVFPKPVMALYSARNPPMWWSPSYGRASAGMQVYTAFVSGDWARALLQLGEEGALNAGLATLRHEMGKTSLRPERQYLVNWPDDPFSRGGYSVATPGHADARTALAAPLNNRLYWAGEATASNAWAATVHGAYASGRRAAAEVIAAHKG